MIPIFSCDTTDHHAHLPRHLAPDKIPHFIAGNFKNSLYPCKGKSKFQIQTLSIYIYIYMGGVGRAGSTEVLSEK